MIIGDLVQKEREEQKRRIIDLYLQCYTQEEIANKIGESQPTVSRVIQKFKTELLNNPPVPESLQLYNVWNWQNRGN
jgi:transposase